MTQINKTTLTKLFPILFGCIAIISGFTGMILSQENNASLSFFQSFYGVFAYFGGNADIDKIDKSIFLEIAAICAPLAVVSALTLAFIEEITKWLFLLFNGKNHIIICGLGNTGYRLIIDMIENNYKKAYAKIVVIEPDENNPRIAELLLRGVIVIEGNANSKKILREAKACNAKKIICTTGSDLINLEIVARLPVVCTNTKKPTVHIHLSNTKNCELLKATKLQQLHIKYFSIYENASKEFLHKIKNQTRFNIAFVGNNNVSQSIIELLSKQSGLCVNADIFNTKNTKKLNELSQLTIRNCHQSKSSITITCKQKDILFDKNTLNISTYNYIIFCEENTNKSFKNAFAFASIWNDIINNTSTQMHIYADEMHEVASLIDNNQEMFKNFTTFGSLQTTSSYWMIVGN